MILNAGDALLYKPKGFFGWVIALKTWHAISHVEIYVGEGKSVASRDGIGVGEYDLRDNELIYVLRPNQPFELKAAYDWFNRRARGQGYDVWGLLRFAWRAPVDRLRFNNKMFCSEMATRFYRNGGLDPFNDEDADAIAPFQFKLSPVFDVYEVTIDGSLAPVGAREHERV